jgi:hypothetical protein
MVQDRDHFFHLYGVLRNLPMGVEHPAGFLSASRIGQNNPVIRGLDNASFSFASGKQPSADIELLHDLLRDMVSQQPVPGIFLDCFDTLFPFLLQL